MDSIKKENIRQDLQDYLDKRAFGPMLSCRRPKTSNSSCKSCPKKEIKNRIHSTLSALVGGNIALNRLLQLGGSTYLNIEGSLFDLLYSCKVPKIFLSIRASRPRSYRHVNRPRQFSGQTEYPSEPVDSHGLHTLGRCRLPDQND